MPIDAALSLTQVSVRLGGKAVLDELDLMALPGEVTAVLGPNGAGKTTMIRCCTGLQPLDGGTITILGRSAGSPGANDSVGLMPQSSGAWSGVRPAELLSYLASLYTHPLKVDELIEGLGIGPFAATAYRRLSGGQQQLVNLAGAVIGRPRVAFLDEPSAGLDLHVRQRVWDLIGSLRSTGVAVVLTTHSMVEAERLADRVALLHRGRRVAWGTVAEVTAGGSLEELFLRLTAEPA